MAQRMVLLDFIDDTDPCHDLDPGFFLFIFFRIISVSGHLNLCLGIG